ncbi:kinesin-like protein subito [Harmonia axyridis]|uniref:kinesin-like protein subito n=1 Tax=Harmonia axyridis TaxID=115357 RepID=UPI001E2792E3|nr:kinesin-like protein subito [Harmonia axyridis]
MRMDQYVAENISYIRSRDPSIQNFNRNNLRNVRLKMKFSVNEMKDQLESVLEEDNYCSEENIIQIYLRLKPSTDSDDCYIIHDNELIYAEQKRRKTEDEETIFKKIEFSKIFDKNSTQEQVFDDIVKVKVLKFLNGKDACLFIYGAPAAGKTFTTLGTEEEPGFIPRTLEYLFNTLPKLPSVAPIKPTAEGKVIKLSLEQINLEQELKREILYGIHRSRNNELYQSMQNKLKNQPFASLEQPPEVELGIWVTFAEIHNEEVYDVLQNCVNYKLRKKSRIASTNGEHYIKDLTHICVSNSLEAYQVYQYGIQKLKFSSSNGEINLLSNHYIFTIKIAQASKYTDTTYISAFSICNLAGKERSKESSGNSNSLMVLGRCITALQHAQMHPNINCIIPYRDSKLTLLFKKTLSGLENFCMLININSSKKALEQNHSILNFPALTKQILTRETFLNYISTETEQQQLEEVIHQTKSSYEELKRNKDYNYQQEKQQVITCCEDILDSCKEIIDMEKKSLIQEFEQQFQRDVRRLKNDMLKKKQDKEILHLKEKFKANKVTIDELGIEIANLDNELHVLTVLVDQERMSVSDDVSFEEELSLVK